jgi:hypothetical protein
MSWPLLSSARVVAAVGGAIFGFWQKNEAEIRKHAAEVANAEAKRQEVMAKENANKEKVSRNAAEEQTRIANEERVKAEEPFCARAGGLALSDISTLVFQRNLYLIL